MALALELHQEPCVVEFDFTNLFSIGETDRITMPAFKYVRGGGERRERERGGREEGEGRRDEG
jgi:hypothetical protein